MKTKRWGWTLVEQMLLVAIIGVLMALSPSLARAAGASAILNLRVPTASRIDLAQAPGAASASLPTPSGTAQDATTNTGIPGWYPLHWTPADSKWQFGLDASLSMGACLERELHDGQWLAGPCRDVLLLAKDHKVAFHLGGAAMSNAEHGNTAFQLRAGFNVGPVARFVASKLPVIDQVLEWNPPPFLSKIADATTIDAMGGPRPVHDASVNGDWTYGVGAKVDVPLDVVYNWLKSGL